jgi:hypothetical protein
MKLENNLNARSENKCELCKSETAITLYEVPFAKYKDEQGCAMICATCSAQIEKKEMLNYKHWSCLTEAMWSEVPAIQVISWRMLNRLRDESWAAENLDMMFLDDDTLVWAKATGDHENSSVVDLHRDAKTAAEKEKIQNAFKTHAGLRDALEGRFPMPKPKVSLGGTKRIGGMGEYGSVMQEDSDPFTARPDFGMELVQPSDGRKPYWRRGSKGEIGIGKKSAAIDPSVNEETMLNNLYHTLSEDNKATFMEKLRTEDGLTELIQFAQEQGL